MPPDSPQLVLVFISRSKMFILDLSFIQVALPICLASKCQYPDQCVVSLCLWGYRMMAKWSFTCTGPSRPFNVHSCAEVQSIRLLRKSTLGKEWISGQLFQDVMTFGIGINFHLYCSTRIVKLHELWKVVFRQGTWLNTSTGWAFVSCVWGLLHHIYCISCHHC